MDWQRRITAGAAQDQLAIQHDADDGIIYVPHDGPVMNQEQVGDAAQPFQGFALINADRLVAQVAARGHDGKRKFGQQQMMERGIGQQGAEVRIAGSDAGAEL